MSLWYPAGVATTAELDEASAALKVARHTPCSHGWRFTPRADSPYSAPAPDAGPSTSAPACTCRGLVPPRGARVHLVSHAKHTMNDLLACWPACGRCGHALLEHGELMRDPPQERTRRARVAVRLDELLEDDAKLLDFAYEDEDLLSLRKCVSARANKLTRRQLTSLCYERHADGPLAAPPGPSERGPRESIASPPSKKARRNAASQDEPSSSIPNADMYGTLSFLLQRALYLELCEAQGGPQGASAACMSQLLSLAKRAVIRLDPSVKHAACKRCASFLLDGVSCTTSVLGDPGTTYRIVRRCTKCGAQRTLGAGASEHVEEQLELHKPPHRRQLSQRQRRRRFAARQRAQEPPRPGQPRAPPPFPQRMRGSGWEDRVVAAAQTQLAHTPSGAPADVPRIREALQRRGGHVVTASLGHRASS